MRTIVQILAHELSRNSNHIENVLALIDEGNTIPFIARYRKEMHGTMDDTLLRTLEERLHYLRNLEARREEVKHSIGGQDKLTDALAMAIDEAATLAELEDLYRPYKQKRRTRASMAKEKGLAQLAATIFAQQRDMGDLKQLASHYINTELGVDSIEDALAGASDMIAERISDDPEIRKKLREIMLREGTLKARAATEDDSVYRLYYAFSQPISRLQGHQILAMNRGEREGVLKVSAGMDRNKALELIKRAVVIPGSPAMAFMRSVVEDAFDRLIEPSMEREIRGTLMSNASEGAIKMFAMNLKPLLLQPPVKGKVTLGLDPAYRTGCKIAVVDGTGKVLDIAVVYPTPPHNKTAEAKTVLTKLIKTHGVKLISIGNGTASRESEQFVAELIAEQGSPVSYAIVNEAGASVYSASKLGAEEFPNFDVSIRSAVSIARRLQDPLAELVKIDPKSIGVGQYQHDMPQNRLDETLAGVVEDCVNAVGVDLNTASASLLARVSGLTMTTAKNIVNFREENGAFDSRRKLLKVPKLGPKTYQQCAGFLRVPESTSIFDHTGVHPESYAAAEKLLTICGYTLEEAAMGKIAELSERVKLFGAEKAAAFCDVGIPTLNDLIKELLKPGRDIREDLSSPTLRTDVMDMEDLKSGMVLSGTVRNVIDFGAFIDIGVHQDGLVHISEVCDKFIRHPSEILCVGDLVKVLVLAVDNTKKRISLSIKQAK